MSKRLILTPEQAAAGAEAERRAKSTVREPEVTSEDHLREILRQTVQLALEAIAEGKVADADATAIHAGCARLLRTSAHLLPALAQTADPEQAMADTVGVLTAVLQIGSRISISGAVERAKAALAKSAREGKQSIAEQRQEILAKLLAGTPSNRLGEIDAENLLALLNAELQRRRLREFKIGTLYSDLRKLRFISGSAEKQSL